MAKGIQRDNLYREITDKIIAELEEGFVPWVQPWRSSTLCMGLVVAIVILGTDIDEADGGHRQRKLAAKAAPQEQGRASLLSLWF